MIHKCSKLYATSTYTYICDVIPLHKFYRSITLAPGMPGLNFLQVILNKYVKLTHRVSATANMMTCCSRILVSPTSHFMVTSRTIYEPAHSHSRL